VDSKVKYASKIIVKLKIKGKIMKQKFLLCAMFLIFIVGLYIPASYSQSPCPNVATVVYAGKIYNTVAIGDQCWLKENLNVGTRINGTSEQTNNGIIEKYCYNDDTVNCTTYGGLYQWAEAVAYTNGATNSTPPNPAFTGNVQGICPSGWHIPTNDDFIKLAKTVSNQGNILKAVGQGADSGAGTNTSGFSALLAGYRGYNGSFDALGITVYFWTTYEATATYAEYMFLWGYSNDIFFYSGYKETGLSVRCLNDIITGFNDHSNSTLPKSIDLLQNFPNPFNPSTAINYSLPKAMHVTLSIYNTMGQEVSKLISKDMSAGVYTTEWNASGFASGVYYYRIVAGNFVQTKKLLLLK